MNKLLLLITLLTSSMVEVWAQGYGPIRAPYPNLICIYSSGYGDASFNEEMVLNFTKNIVTLRTGRRTPTQYNMSTVKNYNGPYAYEISFILDGHWKSEFGINYEYGNYGHADRATVIDLRSGIQWSCKEQ